MVLHEMLHWMGEALDSPQHDNGTDRTYACGRFCGGCTSRGLNPPGPNVDCARCAETHSEKSKCGTKYAQVDMACSPLALCHGTIGINSSCERCAGRQQQACDDTPLGSPSFYCCQACPSNAPKNDKPCASSAATPGTCGQRPSLCNLQ